MSADALYSTESHNAPVISVRRSVLPDGVGGDGLMIDYDDSKPQLPAGILSQD